MNDRKLTASDAQRLAEEIREMNQIQYGKDRRAWPTNVRKADALIAKLLEGTT